MLKNNQHVSCRAFALFEVLLATIILAGMIYLFLSFFTAQQNQLKNRADGNTLGVVVNDLIISVGQTNKCPNGEQTGTLTLVQCMNYENKPMEKTLQNMQIDTINSKVVLNDDS